MNRCSAALLLAGLVGAFLVTVAASGETPSAQQPSGGETPATAVPAASAAVAAKGATPSQADEPLSEAERALRKRVHARWDAVLAMDFDRVYEFATPEYRKIYSKTHFFNRYGGQIERTKIKILRVEFLDEAQSEAIVHLDIYYILKPDFGDPVETTSYNKEAWLEVDGAWWRVEPK